MEVLVAQLEREAHQLEQDGDDIRAIRMMERALAQRIAARMANSLAAAERLIIKYNTVAVRCFKNDDFEAAATLLNSALELTSEGSVIFLESNSMRIKLRGTTLNNFGCLERRRGNMAAAASFLKQSIEHAGQESPASFLNLSAVLTHLGRYTDAVAWCRRAIAMLEMQQINAAALSSGKKKNQQQGEGESSSSSSTTLSASAAAASAAGGGGEKKPEQQQQQQQGQGDSPGLMAIAYHNLASPLEQLDRAAAIAAYRKGLEIARAEIGPNSSTTRSIQHSLDRFLRMAPMQVAAGGGGGGSSGAQSTVQAASDPASAAAAAAANKSSFPGSTGFLPAVKAGSSTASASASSSHIPGANTPRGRAQALANARRKHNSPAKGYSASARAGGYNIQPSSSSSSSSTTPRNYGKRLSPVERGRPRSSGSGSGGSEGGSRGSSRDRRRNKQTSSQQQDHSNAPAFLQREKNRELERSKRDDARRERQERAEQMRSSAKEAQLHAREKNKEEAELLKARREKGGGGGGRNHSRTPPPASNRYRRGGGGDHDDGDDRQQQPRHRPVSAERGGGGGGGKQHEPRPPQGGNNRRGSKSESVSATAAAGGGNNNNNNKGKDTSIRSRREREREEKEKEKEKASGRTTSSSSRGGTATSHSSSATGPQTVSRVPQGAGSGNPVKDLEEEISKKDDIVSFMVARLAALLRAEEDFERCYIAVCRIQCLFRKVRAKTHVANLRYQRQLAVTYRVVRENSAARYIVRGFRNLVARRQEKILEELRLEEILDMHNFMASRMQRMARLWLARRELVRRRADALRHAKALRTLQCWFRKLLAVRKADLLRETRLLAQKEKLSFERQDFAASQIARVFLGRRDALKIHRMRRSMRMIREKELESRRTASAKRIQACFRGFRGRVVSKAKRLARDHLRAKIERHELVQRAVRKLQAFSRGCITRIAAGPGLAEHRKKQRALRQSRFHLAATKINSLCRGHRARQVVNTLLLKRRAERKMQWFIHLLPNLQGFCRGRVSTGKAARRLESQLSTRYSVESRHREERAMLESEHFADRDENVTSLEAEVFREEVLFWRTKDLLRANLSIMRREEEDSKARMIAEREAARLRMELLELATAAPVARPEVLKRKAKIAEDFKPLDQQTFMNELDEEEGRSIYYRASLKLSSATSAASQNQQQEGEGEEGEGKEQDPRERHHQDSPSPNKKPRGPFYAASPEQQKKPDPEAELELSLMSEERAQKEKLERALRNVPPPSNRRGLSTRTREELRREELEQRRQKRIVEMEKEEVERKRVLAEAAGMKGLAKNALEHSSQVLQEPMSQDHREAPVQYPQFGQKQQEGEEEEDTSPRKSLKERVSSQSHEEKRHEWEDFSMLDKYTTAHRDQVLNAITRKSVSLVQACLRQQASLLEADNHARRLLVILPKQKAAARVLSASLCSLVSYEELKKRETLTLLQLKQLVAVSRSTRADVQVIQSFARTKVEAEEAEIRAEALDQERDFAATRIQTSVRDRQSRAQRLERLQRARMEQKEASSSSSSSSMTLAQQQDHQAREYAAISIQQFTRNVLGKKHETTSEKKEIEQEPIVLQKRSELEKLRSHHEAQSHHQLRMFAATLLQAWVRRRIARRKARHHRRLGIARRSQIVHGGRDFEQERNFAARSIQSGARPFVASRQRRLVIAQRSVPAAALQLDAEREYAAVKIQSLARGRAARNRRRGLERQRDEKWAGMLDQELQQEQQQQQHEQQQEQEQQEQADEGEDVQEAAVKIQSAFRGSAARAEAQVLREEKKREWERKLAAEEN